MTTRLAFFTLLAAVVAYPTASFTTPVQGLCGAKSGACIPSRRTHPTREYKALMAVSGRDPRDQDEYRRMKGLEKDSERWFQLQEQREANGELNVLENPAFYVTLFFLTPVAILVWGAASGVIPGFVPVSQSF